jgi:hypothetical protein
VEAPVEHTQVPNVHIVVQSHARWGHIVAALGNTDEPVTNQLSQRIREMRMEMMTMRREPEAIDMDQLVEQQRMILSELRQIPAWGPELKKTAARVETLLDSVGNE